jgi:hypothetical protein
MNTGYETCGGDAKTVASNSGGKVTFFKISAAGVSGASAAKSSVLSEVKARARRSGERFMSARSDTRSGDRS